LRGEGKQKKRKYPNNIMRTTGTGTCMAKFGKESGSECGALGKKKL